MGVLLILLERNNKQEQQQQHPQRQQEPLQQLAFTEQFVLQLLTAPALVPILPTPIKVRPGPSKQVCTCRPHQD